jgi:hypothetical protein
LDVDIFVSIVPEEHVTSGFTFKMRPNEGLPSKYEANVGCSCKGRSYDSSKYETSKGFGGFR